MRCPRMALSDNKAGVNGNLGAQDVMRSGIPLSDAHRADWLDTLG